MRSSLPSETGASSEEASQRIEGLLVGFAPDLGKDAPRYGNHVRRVFGLVRAQGPQLTTQELEQVAVAAVFHDIGIWFDGTFDYLEPSRKHAVDYLESEGLDDWIPVVSDLILRHHQLRPISGAPMAEAFRRADLCDLSFGLIHRGIPAGTWRDLAKMFPPAGFQLRVTQFAAKRTLTHPLSPLPMMRW